MLSRYQKIKTDFDAVHADANKIPGFIRCEASEISDEVSIKIGLKNWETIVSYPSCGNNVTNQQQVFDWINHQRSKQNLVDLPFERGYTGSYSSSNYRINYIQYTLCIPISKYCEKLRIKCETYTDASMIPPLILKGLKKLCFIKHKYEKEPKIVEFVKQGGMNIAFFSMGIQKGILRCRRCGHEKKVYRKGWVGAGGISTSWKALNEKIEKKIDSLPTI